MSTAEAYRHCERITRRQAANFYFGIRLLPPSRRRAMCAVYAFARRVDDIGDGELAAEQKLSGLQAQERALAEMPDGGGDAVMIALADACARFRVPGDALHALIEGVRMDVQGTRYETFDELVIYCRRVAGAIGRACLAIFALREESPAELEHATGLADDLGVALQLTNILRDVREDAQLGRIYLPAEDLRRFELIAAGEELQAPLLIATHAQQNGHVDSLVRFEVQRARTWFQRGLALTPLLDRRSAACVLAMANIYRRVLDRIDAEPERALRERIALSAGEKAWVATRSMVGALAERRRS